MRPGDIKVIFCKLCLNPISHTNCEVIGEVLREVLEVVLPNLNLEERDKHLMCIACSIKLSAAFNFKSTCMDTEDIISSYVNSSRISVVDLKEVYVKEKGNIVLTDISENQKICRLCIHLVKYGYVSLNEVDVDIIDKFMPQLNSSATGDSVICGPCFDSLHTHGSFLKDCLEAQEKYKSAYGQPYITSKEFEIKLEDGQDVQDTYKIINKQTSLKSEKIEIKLEKDGQDEQKECKNANKQSYIKSEEIEIQVEAGGQDGCDSCSCNLNKETVEIEKRDLSKDVGEIKSEYKCETGFNESLTTSLSVNNIQKPNTEKFTFQNCDPSSDTQLYQCDKCKYKTKLKASLKRHQITHKDFSEVPIYLCDKCPFRTKYKFLLKTHQLKHENPSGILTYKCDICTYETKYTSHLKRHQLLHKNSSEIEMYKCDICGYKTKYKNHLKVHQLTHKDASEIQMYTCDTCSFETKYKVVLNRHRLKHKSVSEIQMYKCDTCTYETKYKSHLKVHQLSHKDCSEIQMYKCDACRFETKFRSNLKSHQLKHKEFSQVEMNNHQLIKNPAPIQMCESDTHDDIGDKCHFTCHPSIHKCSNIQVFKCNECVFETKHKQNLKIHMFKHQDPLTVQLYKCDKCVFQTKHKRNLIRHQSVHKNLLGL